MRPEFWDNDSNSFSYAIIWDLALRFDFVDLSVTNNLWKLIGIDIYQNALPSRDAVFRRKKNLPTIEFRRPYSNKDDMTISRFGERRTVRQMSSRHDTGRPVRCFASVTQHGFGRAANCAHPCSSTIIDAASSFRDQLHLGVTRVYGTGRTSRRCGPKQKQRDVFWRSTAQLIPSAVIYGTTADFREHSQRVVNLDSRFQWVITLQPGPLSGSVGKAVRFSTSGGKTYVQTDRQTNRRILPLYLHCTP